MLMPTLTNRITPGHLDAESLARDTERLEKGGGAGIDGRGLTYRQ